MGTTTAAGAVEDATAEVTEVGADPAGVKAAITDDLSSAVLGTLHGDVQGVAAEAVERSPQHGATGKGAAASYGQHMDDGMGDNVEVVMLDTASGEAVAVTGGSGAEAVAAALTQAVQGGAGEEAAAAAAATAAVNVPNVVIVKRLVTMPKLINVNGKPVTW
jgi:hypothetical protein